MDKTLELIMVAVILIVASVVVLSLLQGQSETFGNYSRSQTDSSNCDLSRLKFQRAIDCDASSRSGSGDNLDPKQAEKIFDDNTECAWADTATIAYDTAC